MVAQPMSRRSMQTVLMRLRAFFRWLIDDYRFLRQNPCDRVHKPRWSAPLRPAPSEGEFVALCHSSQVFEEILLLEVLYHTGLRVRELRNLQWNHIDLFRRRLHVTGKGGRPYTLPFPPHVRDLLETALTASAGSGWVFRGPRGARRRVEWIEATLGHLGRAVGLPYPLTAHLLRHGLARTLKATEMPLAAIQQIMRHQSIQTTINLYGRLDLEDVQILYDKHMAGRP